MFASPPPGQCGFRLSRLLRWHLGAVGRTAALALARVLGFAAVVAGLAPALALARVLALTGVLFFHFLAGLVVGSIIAGANGGAHSRQHAGCLNAGACSR